MGKTGVGMKAKAKAFRSSGINNAQRIRNCSLSESCLEKYGGAYHRFVLWLQSEAGPIHRQLINEDMEYTSESSFEEIFFSLRC